MNSHSSFLTGVAAANAEIAADRQGLEGSARAEFVATYVAGVLRACDRLGEIIHHPAFDGPRKWEFHARAFDEIDTPLDEIARGLGADQREGENAGIV